MSACANRTTDHTARPVVPGEPGHRTTNQRETVWVSSQAEAQGCPTVMVRRRRLLDAPTRGHSHTLHAWMVTSTNRTEQTQSPCWNVFIGVFFTLLLVAI